MKLKSTKIREYREEALKNQGMKCGLCGLPVNESDRVHLDHCHKNGWVRSALHSRCNTLLSKVENNYRRMGFETSEELEAFLSGVYGYLKHHEQDRTGVIHPTHKTPEEKKALARKRKKAQQSRAKVSLCEKPIT